MNVIITGFGEIWSENLRCSSKIKPRFRAEWELSSEEDLEEGGKMKQKADSKRVICEEDIVGQARTTADKELM